MVECRRILKWTYAFGYYNFGQHAESKASPEVLKQQQEFFEFNQVRLLKISFMQKAVCSYSLAVMGAFM